MKINFDRKRVHSMKSLRTPGPKECTQINPRNEVAQMKKIFLNLLMLCL